MGSVSSQSLVLRCLFLLDMLTFTFTILQYLLRDMTALNILE